MNKFTEQVQQNLAPFLSYSDQNIEIVHPCFSQKQGYVHQFIQEILATCDIIEQQTESELLMFHTKRLIEQIDCLKKAIASQLNRTQQRKVFRSSYQFSKHIHRLPPPKRLEEYKKVLRALNEKISWLIEQSQQANESDRAYYLAQIEETEFRKRKCIDAIEDLSVLICKR